MYIIQPHGHILRHLEASRHCLCEGFGVKVQTNEREERTETAPHYANEKHSKNKWVRKIAKKCAVEKVVEEKMQINAMERHLKTLQGHPPHLL